MGGGLPCGANPDLKIARKQGGLLGRSQEDEKALADNGYDGEDKFLTPIREGGLTGVERNYNKWVRVILARHEIVNKRLKDFGVLCTVFRHSENYHNTCFLACAVLTQLSLWVEPISI